MPLGFQCLWLLCWATTLEQREDNKFRRQDTSREQSKQWQQEGDRPQCPRNMGPPPRDQQPYFSNHIYLWMWHPFKLYMVSPLHRWLRLFCRIALMTDLGIFWKTDNWPSKLLKIIFSKLKQELNIKLIKIGRREYYRWKIWYTWRSNLIDTRLSAFIILWNYIQSFMALSESWRRLAK
jgi:hypothetical protein